MKIEDCSLRDKIVFVTGGAKGIGRSIVHEFCKIGADVIFCDIDKVAAETVCEKMKEYKCTFIETDISDKHQLTTTLNTIFSTKGDIDIIINNAGISIFNSILETSVEEFDKILSTNLRPIFITAKVMAQHRSKQSVRNKYGRIINIASTRYMMSEPDSESYAASKGGVVSLTHALAISLSKYRITVNCISPGWIRIGDYETLTNIDHLQHPSGRVGKPEDIALACLYLAQPDNNFINGQNIIIDGGMTKKMIYEE